MATIVANDVSAVTPEIWSAVLQDNLYNQLVSFGVANVETRDALKYGDVINKQYMNTLTGAAYTPGTEISIDEIDYVTDQLTVNVKYYTAQYIDDMEQLQANIDLQRPMIEEATYVLKNYIDGQVLYNVTAGVSGSQATQYGNYRGDYCSGTMTATTANIMPLFAGARKILLDNNCEEAGDWCAVLSPREAYLLALKGTGLGFNFADATLRNGYIGDFMGFQVYVSNNLPTSTDVSAVLAGLTAESTVTNRFLYFGRKGRIELLMQAAPTVQIREVSNMIGKNIVVWTLFGDTVYTRNKKRFMCVPVNATATA